MGGNRRISVALHDFCRSDFEPKARATTVNFRITEIRPKTCSRSGGRGTGIYNVLGSDTGHDLFELAVSSIVLSGGFHPVGLS